MDFDSARFNMIEQQIRPWNVLNQDILDLLTVVKREQFVPPAYKAMAFTDMELPLTVAGKATGQTMFSPKIEARILQGLAVRKHEAVVEVGAGSGHMAALLGSRASKVLSFEIDPNLAAFANSNLRACGFGNIEIQAADAMSAQARQRFVGADIIVLSGSVEVVPELLLQALNVGGRIAAIVGQAPVMNAQILTKLNATEFRTEILFETVQTELKNFPRQPRFVF